MNKIIGAAEFKATCLKVIEEMQHDGKAVTITKRGKPVAELKPIEVEKRKSAFGLLRSPEYRFDDPDSPAYDGPWNAELDNDEDDPGTGLR